MKKEKIKLVSSFFLLLLIFVITGCSSKNDEKKFDSDYALQVEFRAKNTLNLPEAYGDIKEDFLENKRNKFNENVIKEKLEAGISQEDINNWEYLDTEVKFYKLEFMYDMVAEKSVWFKNNNGRSMHFDSVYYMDGDTLTWKMLKSTVKDFILDKEADDIKDLNEKSKSIWKCGDLINLCTDKDNAEVWDLIK